MSRKLAVAVPNLTAEQTEGIRSAAERLGFEVLFAETPKQNPDFFSEAEAVFGHWPEVARTSAALRWICTPYAGVDQFLGEGTFRNPGAVLTNSSGAYGVTIAEHTVLMLLYLMRRQIEYRKIVAEHGWVRDLPVRSIRGSRFTLLGTGDIGQETAVRLRAFGPAGISGVNRSGSNPGGLFDRAVAKDGLESLLPETDALIISLPGTEEARHMIGEKQLALLPDGAIVINVGRGSVIDQRALEKELLSGRLYAGLDVFEREPVPAGDPFWELPNLMITPHTAGNMTLPYTVEKIVSMFLEDLENYAAGKPLAHTVDRRRGY